MFLRICKYLIAFTTKQLSSPDLYWLRILVDVSVSVSASDAAVHNDYFYRQLAGLKQTFSASIERHTKKTMEENTNPSFAVMSPSYSKCVHIHVAVKVHSNFSVFPSLLDPFLPSNVDRLWLYPNLSLVPVSTRSVHPMVFVRLVAIFRTFTCYAHEHFQSSSSPYVSNFIPHHTWTISTCFFAADNNGESVVTSLVEYRYEMWRIIMLFSLLNKCSLITWNHHYFPFETIVAPSCSKYYLEQFNRQPIKF